MNKRWNHMPSHQPSRSDGVELSSLIAGLRRNKWIILFCIVLAGVAAFGTLKNIRPSYYSYVEVLLNTRQERVVGVEQVVSDLNVTNSIVAGEIAVLRSNVLIGNVVDELGLVDHPDFDPRLDNGPSYFERLQIRIFGEEPMPEADEETVTGLSDQDVRNIVIWKVRRDLSVFQSGISYVINISMEAHDPEIAAAIANAVAERYIQDQLDAKLAATQRAISWLDNRLFELEGQLRDAEDEVVDFLAQQVLEEGGDKDSVELQLLELNRMFVSARNDRAAADAKLGYVQGLLSTEGLAGALTALETTRLTRLDDELAALERDQAQLATRLGPRHPEMLELQLAVDDLLRDREVAIRAGVAELEAAVAQAQGRETAIADEIRAAQILQVDLSRSSVRLSQLERSASAMRQVYETFLSRFQETTQQLEFQRADARVISKAEPALAPSRPRNKLILAVALFLGAILGISAALIRSMVDPALTSASELEDLIEVPVVGVLPEIGGWWARLSRKNWTWLKKELLKYSRSRYAQNFRLIQSNLIKNEASS